MLYKFPGAVKKVRSNLSSDTDYNKSMKIENDVCQIRLRKHLITSEAIAVIY